MHGIYILCLLSSLAHVFSQPVIGTVNVSTIVQHETNRNYLGCHQDNGYTQGTRGFWANMIYGNSFENGTMKVNSWTPWTDKGVNATFSMQNRIVFNGKPTSSISFIRGGSPNVLNAGLVNRGMGYEGLYLQGGKEYEGYLYMIAGKTPSNIIIQLRDYSTSPPTILASQSIFFNGTSESFAFQRLNFSLTPVTGTECVGIDPYTNPSIDCGTNFPSSSMVCVQCMGEIVVGVDTPGTYYFGYVYLQPGKWARLGDLPILQSGVDVLKTLGVTVLRNGGTFSQAIRWKDHLGPREFRPSLQLVWGDALIDGFGPFEMLDMLEQIDIIPIITFAYDINSLQDFIDLVEYCWGDATTYWGARRIANGHPGVYNLTFFELGNEQYSPLYVDQVLAMEAKSMALNVPVKFKYLFPSNSGVNAQDAQRLVDAGFDITRVMPDLHTGAGGAVFYLSEIFNSPVIPGFNQSGINCETNAAVHHVRRAMEEAEDLMKFFNLPDYMKNRILARTASFCSSRSGHFDGFDQGLSTFLPNMTWFQPPGYVHIMVVNSWRDHTSYSNITGNVNVTMSSHISNDLTDLVVRVVNVNTYPVTVTIELGDATITSASINLSTLTGDENDDNPPSNPTHISPVSSQITPQTPQSFVLNMPAWSFIVAQMLVTV
jgi:Alpha-L-arabinofuranosidase C-terminal domain